MAGKQGDAEAPMSASARRRGMKRSAPRMSVLLQSPIPPSGTALRQPTPASALQAPWRHRIKAQTLRRIQEPMDAESKTWQPLYFCHIECGVCMYGDFWTAGVSYLHWHPYNIRPERDQSERYHSWAGEECASPDAPLPSSGLPCDPSIAAFEPADGIFSTAGCLLGFLRSQFVSSSSPAELLQPVFMLPANASSVSKHTTPACLSSSLLPHLLQQNEGCVLVCSKQVKIIL